MGIRQWFRKRKAQKIASGPLGDQGKFYYLMSYKDEYKDLVSKYPESDDLLSELFLFRFWLTQYAYRLCKPDGITDDDLLNDMIPTGLTLGRGMFERLNHVNIEETLGDNLSALMEDRFGAYDSVVISSKMPSDPFGLSAASLVLAATIFDNPQDETISYLAEKAKQQFSGIFSTWSGSEKSDANPHNPPDQSSSKIAQKDTSNWLIVNEFGGSKVFIDKLSTIHKGDLVSVNVLYDLEPCGTDKRNNKAVKKMINLEEYDLTRGKFRVHRIDFVYDDGTHGDPLKATPEWVDASAGNGKTLAALKRLAATPGGI